MFAVFSSRQKWDLPANPLSQLRAEKRRRGSRILDLTESNPTQAGFEYPRDILSAFADPAALRYHPHPRGLPTAREAVLRYYSERGVEVPASRILLTASTSEAYSYLFKLLADPGDEILVPRPSYPLFEFLAGLESAIVRQYPLRYDGAWHVDFEALAAAVTRRTRAVVVVNPNNPTGSFLRRDEAAKLEELAARHGLAILSDEVFADYGFVENKDRVATLANTRSALTFSMSGLSKIAGLPQVKLGWIVASGPEHQKALERLEWIADTFLSVATPVQTALPRLLAMAEGVRAQIRQRTSANLELLRARTADSTANVLNVEAGWCAILQIPRTLTEEQWALGLLRDQDVLVQPGYFYDFESEAFLVVSLLTEASAFEQGIDRILSYILAPPLQISTSPLT
jgi:alanine-synthesizing transaminase